MFEFLNKDKSGKYQKHHFFGKIDEKVYRIEITSGYPKYLSIEDYENINFLIVMGNDGKCNFSHLNRNELKKLHEILTNLLKEDISEGFSNIVIEVINQIVDYLDELVTKRNQLIKKLRK